MTPPSPYLSIILLNLTGEVPAYDATITWPAARATGSDRAVASAASQSVWVGPHARGASDGKGEGVNEGVSAGLVAGREGVELGEADWVAAGSAASPSAKELAQNTEPIATTATAAMATLLPHARAISFPPS